MIKIQSKVMKIGLLECDHVREEFRHIAGDYRDMFPALFLPIAPYWKFVCYDVVNGHFPTSINDCEAYLCTGSKYSVYDDEPWIHQLKTFVNDLYHNDKPFVGVCFGHQLLAEALGGKVQKADIGWCVGVHEFQIFSSEFRVPSGGVPQNVQYQTSDIKGLNLLMMCQDQVVKLPPNSIVMAITEDCRVAMFRVGERMLGIQAHPEFTAEYEEALMKSRVERIGVEKVTRGLESLSSPLDSKLIAKWIVDFVTFAV
ncbi:MAG: gamma-glutamyl-gamma-aminobutyrate hydrolase family protein [Spirosomataceae bacterium]